VTALMAKNLQKIDAAEREAIRIRAGQMLAALNDL
jgi:hypothetical protein